MDRLDRDLSEYEDRMKQSELAAERFADYVYDNLEEVKDILFELQADARNFEDGYDFTDYLSEILNDELSIYLGRRK